MEPRFQPHKDIPEQITHLGKSTTGAARRQVERKVVPVGAWDDGFQRVNNRRSKKGKWIPRSGILDKVSIESETYETSEEGREDVDEGTMGEGMASDGNPGKKNPSMTINGMFSPDAQVTAKKRGCENA
ncbi:hypothetical protein R1sor_002031 [Riccia sorocarpa]|uniref:Uncharacterized protein n=1 Tax=Riccia sorocarpa TaxID=122646 RepID=A0ABD3H1M0_9MARC